MPPRRTENKMSPKARIPYANHYELNNAYFRVKVAISMGRPCTYLCIKREPPSRRLDASVFPPFRELRTRYPNANPPAEGRRNATSSSPPFCFFADVPRSNPLLEPHSTREPRSNTTTERRLPKTVFHNSSVELLSGLSAADGTRSSSKFLRTTVWR